MEKSITMIGLGKMGLPMAENLLAAGYALTVFNRTVEKAAGLVSRGAVLAESPSVAVATGGIVVSMVADDRALLSLADDTFCLALGAGIHLSMSTVSAETNRTLSERHARFGGQVVAAPVFGRPEAAATRKLWIATSGPGTAKAQIKSVLDALGQGVFDFGEDVGAANVVKLAGNFLLAAAIEAMAEASAMAEKNGVPRAAMLQMMTSTIFNCPIYVNYGRGIIQSDFTEAKFSIPLILKDMHLVQHTAAASRAPMPIVNILCDRYLTALAKGRETYDSTALALGAAEDAGLNWLK